VVARTLEEPLELPLPPHAEAPLRLRVPAGRETGGGIAWQHPFPHGQLERTVDDRLHLGCVAPPPHLVVESLHVPARQLV
jgi:hypothetical protein